MGDCRKGGGGFAATSPPGLGERLGLPVLLRDFRSHESLLAGTSDERFDNDVCAPVMDAQRVVFAFDLSDFKFEFRVLLKVGH